MFLILLQSQSKLVLNDDSYNTGSKREALKSTSSIIFGIKIDQSLCEIIQVLSGNIFERTQINQLFAEFDYKSCKDDSRQGLLF
jgi:hypothetical protein